jgi:hypothetical protein
MRGGRLVAIDAAARAFTDVGWTGVTDESRTLRGSHSWAPGPVVELVVDATRATGWGCATSIAAMVTDSPWFGIRPAAGVTATVVARYPAHDPLLAGWLEGWEVRAGQPAVVDVAIGRGRLILFGMRPGWRRIADASARLLYNAVFASTPAPREPVS